MQRSRQYRTSSKKSAVVKVTSTLHTDSLNKKPRYVALCAVNG